LRNAVERLSQPVQSPGPAVQLAARATALIIEDTPINYKVLSCMLRELGHPSVWAEDGPQGLSLLKERAFELVFLDLNLPTLDGLEVARSIRKLPPERQPYLVAFTASVGQRGALVEAGVDDVLTKPIDFEALSQVLDAWHERALRS
jgi:CheY-like chemotaxis protein